MAKWDNNFYTGRVGGMDVLKKMVQKGVLNDGKEIEYANGLVIGKYRGLQTIEHAGGDAGFRTHFLRFPNQQTSVICFSNFETIQPALISKKIADIILKEVLENLSEEKIETEESKIKNPNEIVGLYSVDNTFTFRISSLDAQFYIVYDFLNPIGLPKNPLKPKGDVLFQNMEGQDLSFQDFDGEKYQSVSLSGWDLPAKRLIQKDISHENLIKFTGKYYSHELLRIYEFSIKDNEFILNPPRGKVTKFLYFDNDLFLNELQEVKFDRNKQSTVVGFRISNSRITNLKFERNI